jgi:rhomboid protease GluP
MRYWRCWWRVFAAECVFAIGPLKELLQPSLATLEALGGLRWPRVVESGEWYRLLSATFLHAYLLHLALNAFVLFYAGRRLEWIIGHSWFAAIYFISAVCGSIVSLALNPANLVGIGRRVRSCESSLQASSPASISRSGQREHSCR